MEAIWRLGLAFLLHTAVKCLTEKNATVIKFQDDGNSLAESYLQFKGEIPSLNAFSLCFRLKIFQARSPSTILSYSAGDLKNELVIYLNAQEEIMDISCCYNNFLGTNAIQVSFFQWHSFCLSIDLAKGTFILVQNGNVSFIKNLSKANYKKNANLRGNGTLLFGQDQDAIKYNPLHSFSGAIADFYFFSITLSVKEMVNFTLCRNKINKTAVAHFEKYEDDYIFYNVTFMSKKFVVFCAPMKTIFKIFTDRKSFCFAKSSCHSLGGKIYYPSNDLENKELFNLSISSDMCNLRTSYYYDSIWLGIVAKPGNDDLWIDYKTEDPISYTNFALSENKDSKKFSCVTIYSCESDLPNLYGKWMMRKCTDVRKHVCKFDHPPVLRLRGLCKNSLIDRMYTLSPQANDINFHGYYFSKIYATSSITDDFDGAWIIKRTDKPALEAKFLSYSEIHYPIGKNKWTIQNDICNLTSAELKLTVCNNGEFTCDDGTCISLIKRCDLRYNCLDGSDEVDCYPVVLPPSYYIDIPPPTLEEKKTNEISVHVSILNIKYVNIISFEVSLEIYMEIVWRDSRLKFKNLSYSNKNTKVEDVDKYIWKPDFTFIGPSNTSSEVINRHSSFSIWRKTNASLDNDENISEDLIYEGGMNPLIWEVKNTVKMNCQFDLVDYPFDTQVCDLTIKLKDMATDNIDLSLTDSQLEYYGPRRLLEYEVVNVSISLNEKDDMTIVRMTFRNLMSYFIASTFAPTFLMMVVGYLTFYFPVNEFEERIGVSLTALLVQSTFFSEVNDSVPHTVSLKKIDIWCIFCILILFCITTALTIINLVLSKEGNPKFYTSAVIHPFNGKHHRRSEILHKFYKNHKNHLRITSEGLNFFCRICFPVCTLTFLLGYFLAASSSM